MDARVFLQNPYVNRSAIDSETDFFGRIAELRSIYSRVTGGQSVYLIGERRVGKSSILNALDFPTQREDFGIPGDYVFTKIDLQFLSGCSEETFLACLQNSMSDVLDIPLESPDRRGMELAARSAKKSGRRLTILLDEFDVLVNNPRISSGFLGFLRSWSAMFKIPFVGAFKEGSTQRLTEDDKTGSAFLNIFGSVYVGALNEDDARELVTIPARSVGVEFTNEEIDWILDVAGYFALHLQIACYHLLELKWSRVAGDELRAALERQFAFEAMPHFEYLLDNLSDAEQTALSIIADGRAADTESTGELARKGILITDNGRVRIFSKVFSKLARNRPPKKTSPFFSRLME